MPPVHTLHDPVNMETDGAGARGAGAQGMQTQRDRWIGFRFPEVRGADVTFNESMLRHMRAGSPANNVTILPRCEYGSPARNMVEYGSPLRLGGPVNQNMNGPFGTPVGVMRKPEAFFSRVNPSGTEGAENLSAAQLMAMMAQGQHQISLLTNLLQQQQQQQQ